MKLKPVKRKLSAMYEEPVKEEPKKRGKKKKAEAEDEYQPMFEPIRILVRDYTTESGNRNKDYLEFSVKRWDDDEAPACVFVTMYRESERYTGYLKGKTTYFPITSMYEVLSTLQDVSDKCEEIGIEF